MKTLRQKIMDRDKIVGTHVQLTDPGICEIMGRLGYDFFWIDLEHTYMSYKELFCHVCAAHDAGTPVIVRVPMSDRTATKKVLEMGVDGIIFPQISSVEEANSLISYTLYPPYGDRGFGPMGAVNWGYDDVQEYVDKKHLDLCRFIQIELKAAVDQLEELMKNPYIDGYILGPCDLSGSIGKLNRVFDPEVVALVDKTVATLHSAGKYVGLSTGASDRETLAFWHDRGVDMLSAGSDNGAIFEVAKRTLGILREVCNG